jgi:hypothetical protein
MLKLTQTRAISDFPKFGNLLYDRYYVLLRHYGILKEKFTLILNLYDYSKEVAERGEIVVYAGVSRQRELLKADKDELNNVWNSLEMLHIGTDRAVASKGVIDQFKEGDLGINDIHVQKLEDYFAKPSEWNESKKLEHPILDKYFDIKNTRFLSLPVIQFGTFAGVAHLIFDIKELETDERAEERRVENIKQIIRMFSVEFESLLWDWNLEGDNIYRESSVSTKMIDEAIQRIRKNKNPILTDLQYIQYYNDSRLYINERVRQNDEAQEKILKEHRRRAIIAILIDSYAHNISAHSLTVLKWWFQQRAGQFRMKDVEEELLAALPFDQWGQPIADFLLEKFPGTYNIEALEQGILGTLARWYWQLKQKQKPDHKEIPVRDQLFPLAAQLAPLFKFLLEKGAFWSGVTRDEQFGGEIRNLFDVLWNDFIENPLYLGTIAYSEKITRLNIRIRVYDRAPRPKEADKETFKRTYTIREGQNGELLDGILASIDVGGIPERSLKHDYVMKGEAYELLKPYLENCEVFFPGSVVGKHAFFTIIENEIRNVKHFGEEALHEMRTNGLTLTIAIRETSLNYKLNVPTRSLYKIGVWLHHKTPLFDGDTPLLIKRLEGMEKDIITKGTHRARLGGNQQDKICAAMLFNNTFISVQDKKSLRDQIYYPWLRAAMSYGLEENGTVENDFELQLDNIAEGEKELATHNHAEEGYFKKYFHLWQGDFLLHLEDDLAIENENIARFQIVNITDPALSYKQIRNKGVIRVLEQADADIKKKDAYRLWLKQWFEEEIFRVIFRQGKTQAAFLIHDGNGVQYFTQEAYGALPSKEKAIYGDYEEYELPFIHGDKPGLSVDSSAIEIRSHGVLATHFFEHLESVNDLGKSEIKNKVQLYELAEVLRTRICIFDKRISDRVSTQKQAFLKEHLLCEIYDEQLSSWQEVQQEGWDDFHFVIVHLSFIEALKDKAGKKYQEKGIVDFIRDEILKGRKDLGKNFMLVITTGRGRTEWLKKLQESPDYNWFTTFRPVEALIEAVERGSLKKDDIELKYNLIKVLMGS